MTNRNGFDKFAGGGLDDSQLITVLADYVEQAPVWGDGYFDGG
jgi:hypothetical protein